MLIPRRPLTSTSPPLHYKAVPYSEEELAKAFSNEWLDSTAVKQRQYFGFFREYLGPTDGGLHSKTIVCEWPYVSQSYLEDYANYYARGFAPYERDCKRVHFFSADFTDDELLNALLEHNDKIWDSYLGYVVIKPIPAPMGATLLKPYADSEQKERCHSVRRPYHINLLGKKLTIETLIWQQQDTNVSACATTALWMAFHKTAFLFQTPLPSPYHITESAGNLFQNSGRTFPNRGLDPFQIMTAIQSVGLVSELRNKYIEPQKLESSARARQLRQAKGFIHAYLRMGIPVMLFIKFENGGRHLIAATGYRKPVDEYSYVEDIERKEVDGVEKQKRHLTLLSDGIERMYAHDDGVGPYSRLGFDDASGLLITAWPQHGADWQKAHLFTVAVPLISDVRIQYEQVYEQAAFMNIWLQYMRKALMAETGVIVWDIHLQYSNIYKENFIKDAHSSPEQSKRVITRLLPKYLWIARALCQNIPVMEFIFDATDLHTGFYCLLTTTYEPLRTPLTIDMQKAGGTAQAVLSKLGKGRYADLLTDDLGLSTPTAP